MLPLDAVTCLHPLYYALENVYFVCSEFSRYFCSSTPCELSGTSDRHGEYQRVGFDRIGKNAIGAVVVCYQSTDRPAKIFRANARGGKAERADTDGIQAD